MESDGTTPDRSGEKVTSLVRNEYLESTKPRLDSLMLVVTVGFCKSPHRVI